MRKLRQRESRLKAAQQFSGKSGLEACAPNTPLCSCGSVRKQIVGTWESVPPASHAHPLIPITQLVSPQTSSHVKAAVSKSPLTDASTQECFLPTLLGVYSLQPHFSSCREPSSAWPTLFQEPCCAGWGGQGGGQPGSLGTKVYLLHTGPHSSSTCWYKAHSSSLAVLGPWASLAKPSRATPLAPLQAPQRQDPPVPCYPPHSVQCLLWTLQLLAPHHSTLFAVLSGSISPPVYPSAVDSVKVRAVSILF